MRTNWGTPSVTTTTFVVVPPMSTRATVPVVGCGANTRVSANGMRSTSSGTRPASRTAVTFAITVSLTAAISKPLMTGPDSPTLSDTG